MLRWREKEGTALCGVYLVAALPVQCLLGVCTNIQKAIIRDLEAIRKPRAIQSRCLFHVVWKGLLLCQCPEVSKRGIECSQAAS